MLYKDLLERSRKVTGDAAGFNVVVKAYLEEPERYPFTDETLRRVKDRMRRHRDRIDICEEDIVEVQIAQQALAQLPWRQRVWRVNLAYAPVDEMLRNVERARGFMERAEERLKRLQKCTA